ncbi:hypothetical protein CDAR_546551 [Caerostris darwini]|uniref:Uncharacterized protein n=1 Tax=Caerostris darwini TaxID=1538125 RepID=A0AAV4U4Q8_9ARAC|nr:hypothetical protein CDAR_546551 [Caerostris darwini]
MLIPKLPLKRRIKRRENSLFACEVKGFLNEQHNDVLLRGAKSATSHPSGRHGSSPLQIHHLPTPESHCASFSSPWEHKQMPPPLGCILADCSPLHGDYFLSEL